MPWIWGWSLSVLLGVWGMLNMQSMRTTICPEVSLRWKCEPYFGGLCLDPDSIPLGPKGCKGAASFQWNPPGVFSLAAKSNNGYHVILKCGL